MRREIFLMIATIATFSLVEAAKQQVQLSDSYLPVAMQIIAHLVDQMSYEAKDETNKPSKPTTKRPASTNRPYTTSRPTTTTAKPQYVMIHSGSIDKFWDSADEWWEKRISTTPSHKPGLYAPAFPPKPSDRFYTKSQQRLFLLPFDNNSQYTVIQPPEQRTKDPFLSVKHEEISPLVEPMVAPHLLPYFDEKMSRSGYVDEEFNEENLQYLSENVREMIRMAHDPNDDKVVDVWEELRAGPQETGPNTKLSSSHLRLLLLYDLLSREAKRQRLSDYPLKRLGDYSRPKKFPVKRLGD